MTCQTNGQTQGPCPNYSFSASTNRITTSGFTYDAAGDLTSDGTHSYQYDAGTLPLESPRRLILPLAKLF